MKIKVLLCSPQHGSGGIASWTRHILKYAEGKEFPGISLSFLDTSSPNKKSVLADTPLLQRLRIGIKNYTQFQKRLRAELGTKQYDVVHLTSSASLSLINDLISIRNAHRHGAKAVIHFRFGRIPELFSDHSWERSLLERVIRKADQTIVIDKASYNTLVSNGFTNIRLLPNFVSPSVVDFIENNSFPRKDREVFFAGHIVVSKGVFELVKACKQIPGIHLTMMGEYAGEIVDELKTTAGDGYESRLTFAGVQPIEKVLEGMMSCSVFVLPTYTEGFPNVILESMACGCPIVTTDVGAIPEMLDIENGSDYGICVKPKQVDELRDAIIRMLNNKEFASSCGGNAQKRVNELYSMSKVWGQMMAIWNLTIGHHAGTPE